MNEYHKIQTVWLRDPETKFKTLLTRQWAKPEFEYLAEAGWRATEKVDGTNIRVIYHPRTADGGGTLEFKGKTDAAQIPPFLLDKLKERFNTTSLNEVFTDFEKGRFPDPVCLYGEGYGARIQKGGSSYIPDGVDFILFDVKIGNTWLTDESMREIGAKLGIRCVPVVQYGSLEDIIATVQDGFLSWLASGVNAEGVVCKPMLDLLTRHGERVITKIKYKDFKHE